MLRFIKICLLLSALATPSFQSELVDYYVNLISEAMANALDYESPTDASEYEASSPSTTPEEFGEFDFIIVGAGSAGSVLGGRLSEISQWKILVIEAGDYGNNLTEIPGMYFNVESSKYNWNFKSIPQNNSCLGMVNNQCTYPRGKGVGGTSLVNGMVKSNCNKQDFDIWWPEGWSYKDVLPYFIKSENTTVYNAEIGYHGYSGPFHAEYHHPNSPQLYTFLEANVERGRKILDYNGREELGVSAAQLNALHGRRVDLGKAYLIPALKRKNLKVQIKSYATRILFDEYKRAYGVTFNHNGKRYMARATKEVIVSCGSLQSPQLLQLSGIGPEDILKKFKIPAVKTLKGVGRNLQDHPTFYGLAFTMDYQERVKSLREYVEEYLNGTGPFTLPGNNGGVGFFQTKLINKRGLPDIELMLIPSNGTGDTVQKSYGYTDETYENSWAKLDSTRFFKIYVILLRPESKGTVKLKSANPFDYPLIDSQFLSDDCGKDIATLYEGVLLVLDLLKTKAFRKMNVQLELPDLPACRSHEKMSKDHWYCLIRQMSMNLYHPMCTCAMGLDPERGAVVDPNFKVFGVENLRVVDASAFPNAVSGHPNSVIVMMAEKISDAIKNDYGHW